jgi:hypothetical protein
MITMSLVLVVSELAAGAVSQPLRSEELLTLLEVNAP